MLKKDDIITTAYKGIFKVIRVEKRFRTTKGHDYILYEGQEETFDRKFLLDEYGNRIEMNPLIHVIKIVDDNFKSVNSNIEFCFDSSYCQSFEISSEKMILELQNKLNRLIDLKEKFKK